MVAKGNLNKTVVVEIVKDVNTEQLETLFTSKKTGKACGLASRARTVEVLGLTGAKKKAIEEYTYPSKPKKRKAVVNNLDYSKLKNDNLLEEIKLTNTKLNALKKELSNRTK